MRSNDDEIQYYIPILCNEIVLIGNNQAKISKFSKNSNSPFVMYILNIIATLNTNSGHFNRFWIDIIAHIALNNFVFDSTF